MGDFKGSSVTAMRDILKKRGEDAEKFFLSTLTKEEKDVYQTCMAFSWIPVEQVINLYKKVVPVLYPNSPEKLGQITRDIAKHDLSGIYKILLRFSNVPTVMKQIGDIWNTYCNKGHAHSEQDPNAKKFHVVVTDYPDMPREMLETIGGYFLGMLEYVGVRNLQVNYDKTNPNAWKWTATWI